MTEEALPGGPARLATHVQGFVSLLRHHGVRVGQAEVLDAFQALEVLGDPALESRDAFQATLRCTLAKSMADARTFNHVFELYFSGGVELDDKLTASLLDQLMERMHGEGEVAALFQVLQERSGGMTALTKALLGLHSAQLAQAMQKALTGMDLSGMQSRLQLAYFAQRLLARLGVDGMDRDLAELRAALAERFPPQDVQAALATLDDRQAALRRTARKAMEAELEKRDLDATQKHRSILDKPFARLSPAEVAQMRTAVRELAQRLKSVFRRRRSEHRGALDVRRTLRANMGRGGVPYDVHFRRRVRERPQLAVLCDVSDSVRHASMFMLQLVYTLQELFTRVRSFVFVSDLGETTALFKEHPVEQAVDLSVAGQVVNLHANSNFGRAFLGFYRHHLDAVTRHTTVLVLGDGRNNYNPAHAWVLHEVRRRARRLLWLCPEDRATWGYGDSEMTSYARACDQVEVVQNLQHLRRVVGTLLK